MSDNKLSQEELIQQVKLAINPVFENWILFEHGTYIIIEDSSDPKEIEAQGVEKMKQFGPVEAGTPSGDFQVITLTETSGWIVAGHGYGMYTYVHPSELYTESPESHIIGLLGRSKREEDGQACSIIYIHTAL